MRVDVISIKDYLEKQHDIHNKEVADLQGQVISLRKELFERTRELEQFAKSDELKELEIESKELDEKLAGYEFELAKLQRSGSIELEKKSSELQKENKNIRSEFYRELGDIDKKFRDTKLRLAEEQSRLLEQKLNKLNKSVEEVEGLKKELRVIVRQAKTKGLSEERLKRLEPKIREKSVFTKVKEAVADFLFEEPLFEEEVEEKPRKKEKKESGWLWWLILIFLVMLLIIFGYLYFQKDIARVFAGAVAGVSKLLTPGPTPEAEIEPRGPVISVYEGDFVDIVPNMSDADNDRLMYIFTEPLNESGQWQTQEGDAGTYFITVKVSDGKTESTLNFTLIVKAKQ